MLERLCLFDDLGSVAGDGDSLGDVLNDGAAGGDNGILSDFNVADDR